MKKIPKWVRWAIVGVIGVLVIMICVALYQQNQAKDDYDRWEKEVVQRVTGTMVGKWSQFVYYYLKQEQLDLEKYAVTFHENGDYEMVDSDGEQYRGTYSYANGVLTYDNNVTYKLTHSVSETESYRSEDTITQEDGAIIDVVVLWLPA